MLNVLIPLDGSRVAEAAVRHALPLLHPFDARVTLLRVVAPNEFRSEETFNRVDWRLQLAQAQSYLGRVAELIRSVDIPCDIRVREGQPADIILKSARELETQLLVMSSYGRGGAYGFVRGGEASKILSKFDASVLLVDGRTQRALKDVRYRRLLVPLDGSCQSETAFRVAILVAESTGAELVISLIIEEPKLPAVLRYDSRAVASCHEIVGLAKAAANQRLDVLRSSIPPELKVSSEIRLTQEPELAIAELQQRYSSDLIVCSENLVDASKVGNDAQSALSPVPVLFLNAENAGHAFRPRFAMGVSSGREHLKAASVARADAS